MAKGSAMGLWRGKKGSTVFYALKNSNNGQRQAMRERVYEISNPKTSQQASQRLKLSNAVKVYNRLKSIIRRSWEGLPYGGDGHREFMKYALKMSTGYPYVPKDFDQAIPGEYIIAKGTLAPIVCGPDESEPGMFNVELQAGDSTEFTTVGAFSTAVLAVVGNQLKEGDQLTFVVCSSPSDSLPSAIMNWNYGSIFLDPSDSTPISEALPFVEAIRSDNPVVSIEMKVDAYVNAAAVIHSRPDGNSYLRSTTHIWVQEKFMAYWTGASQVQASRVSYMSAAASQSTDWPVQPEEEGEVTVPALYTLSGLTGEKAEANGKKVWVRKNTSDEMVAVYAWPDDDSIDADGLIAENGSVVSYGSSTMLPLKPSDVTALASLPIIRTTTVPTA